VCVFVCVCVINLSCVVSGDFSSLIIVVEARNQQASKRTSERLARMRQCWSEVRMDRRLEGRGEEVFVLDRFIR